MTRVTVRLLGANGEQQVSLSVDVGSPFTWINHQELISAGVVPSGFRTFKTREGATLGREVGEASIEVLSTRVTTPVVFAQSRDTLVLGKAALLQLGFEMDEPEGELRKLNELRAYQLTNEPETLAKSA